MEDIFEKLTNLSNVAIRHLMNENNTTKELEEGMVMLINVSYSLREALEKDMESEIMIAAIDSVVGEEYAEENPESKLPNDPEARDKIVTEWIEKKGSGYLKEKKIAAIKKLINAAERMDWLIKKTKDAIKAVDGKQNNMWNNIKISIGKKIEPVLEKKLGEMAQDDFNKLLTDMKKDPTNFQEKLSGYGKRYTMRIPIEFPKKGGRRTRKRKRRRRTKKKRRKRNLKKRTKRRRRSKRRRRR